MRIEYDPAKNARNIVERGLPFELTASFDFQTALIAEDARRDYGEERLRAIGLIGDRVYVLVFTIRRDHLRVISLRRANSRERKRYEEARPRDG